MADNNLKVNPQALQQSSKSSAPKAQTGSFDALMGATQAMTPFAGELSYGLSGNPTTASVISAAMSSFPAAASAMSGSGYYGAGGGFPSFAGGYGMGSGASADSQIPGITGMMGSHSYGAFGASATTASFGTGSSQALQGTNLSPNDLMQTMSSNNMQLIELQAIMQSNMQEWTTKSNILSADHRAKMSLVEKFTARG